MTAPAHSLVLVTGAMRSGTTLLQQVLCSAPEANPFVHGCRYLTSQIELFARYAGPDRLYIDDYLGGPQELFDFTRDLLERLLGETHRRLGSPRHLVLKNPELARVLPAAALLLPRARFVVALRDPKDTVASMITVGDKHRQSGQATFLAGAGRDLEQLCAAYRQFYAPVLQALAQSPDRLKQRLCFVRYEALIGNTERSLARLAAFTGIPLAPAQLAGSDGWRSNTGAGGGAVAQHPRWSAYLTALSGGPISAASIGRHRDVLSADEAQRVEALCADLVAAFDRLEA